MSDSRPVLFIDSGIGGLPYCADFHKKNPAESVCYLADTKNFPYGPRKKEELISILASLTENLLNLTNPKIIVLACNTATVSSLAFLREKFPNIPFVGTVPALKPAAKTSNSGKIGVLGTESTIREIQNLNLINDNSCRIIGISAPDLVEFVECRFDKASSLEKKEIVKKYVDLFRKEGADTLVLGCTHFLYLIEEFRAEASNSDLFIEVFDSLAGITKRIEFLLDENEGLLRAGKNQIPSRRLLLTGNGISDSVWQKRAQELRFELNIL